MCVTPPLLADNYHGWTLKMKRVLDMKNKFRFVDGSIPILNVDDLNYVVWERSNNLAHSWITSSTPPSIAESIVFIENASGLWNNLKDIFMCYDRIPMTQ